MTIKAIGRQWYWTYEYPLVSRDNLVAGEYQLKKMIFDSYLDADAAPKLLSVDRHIYVPIKTQIRVLVTASDVLHSWAVPSLGLKVDACPGRLNQIGMYISRPGFFHGQCSELCGENHGFMPIVVEATDDLEKFDKWYLTEVGEALQISSGLKVDLALLEEADALVKTTL